jgi:hypothetical protein
VRKEEEKRRNIKNSLNPRERQQEQLIITGCTPKIHALILIKAGTIIHSTPSLSRQASEARPMNLFPPRCIEQPNRLPRRSVVLLNVLLRPGWRCYLVKSLWVSFVFDVRLAPYELFSTCRSRAWGRRNLLGRSFHGSG